MPIQITATEDATKIVLVGHGIGVDTRHEIGPGVFVCPPFLGIRGEELEARTASQLEYAAILSMGGQATLAIEVHEPEGGKKLAVRGWNAVWLFGLLSMACRLPCQSMFAFSDGTNAIYSLVARNVIIIPRGVMRKFSEAEAQWMRTHVASYDTLIAEPRFQTALRAYTNAHYLFDLDQQLMLIWAGIEGLLAVDGELSRRIALHAAMLSDGTRDERIARFHRVKKAYGFRSRVVHGSGFDNAKLAAEHHFASTLLIELLAKCVTLGRLPTFKELDEAAAAVSFS